MIYREIEEELSHLVEENPGVLTQSQIESIKDSMNKIDQKLALLKHVLLKDIVNLIDARSYNRNTRV